MRLSLEDESYLAEILSAISRDGSKILSLYKSEPNLEDVFIQMVGRKME